MLLKLDLQMFAEGGDDDSLDFDDLLAEFENEWEETESEESTEIDHEGDQEVEETETDDSQVKEETTPPPNPNDEDTDKRNRAFADLRRQADENKRYADFIQKLADDSGVKPEDILARYEEQRMTQEAEKQGLPVEHLKKLNDTESRLAQLEQQLFVERLDGQLQNVIAKYGEQEPLIRATFDYMAQMGIDPRQQAVDFEKMYRAANLDAIIQQEVEKSRQQDLSDKKKRQESASVPNGSSATRTNNDLSDDDVDAILKRMDIRI